jgi:hypothetical protein
VALVAYGWILSDAALELRANGFAKQGNGHPSVPGQPVGTISLQPTVSGCIFHV